ncbi:MAG: hypothetical protein NC347_14050 [Clostridium sp.]|nr:hypothetical protein [Clostridium sp.]
MKDIQETINNLLMNNFTNQELEQYLDSQFALVKANAIMAVFRNGMTESRIIQKLNFISRNIQNEPKLLGEWTTGHCAMAVLFLLKTEDAIEMYNCNIKKLDKYTQESIGKLIEQIPLCFESEEIMDEWNAKELF